MAAIGSEAISLSQLKQYDVVKSGEAYKRCGTFVIAIPLIAISNIGFTINSNQLKVPDGIYALSIFGKTRVNGYVLSAGTYYIGGGAYTFVEQDADNFTFTIVQVA